MEVRLAKSAGFCFGVKKAVEQVYDKIDEVNETNKNEKIYTYGPIIHNEQVVKDLETKGVDVINHDDLERIEEGTVVLRSHGVEKKVYEDIEASCHSYVDVTCPFVKRIHKIVEKESAEGKQIVIIGTEEHPEVQGIMGWCSGNVIVIETEEEARSLKIPKEKEICVVAQTTFNYIKFHKLVEILEENSYNVNIVNTICNATEERQTEAREIARDADVMIVIGGKHSSNSRKLYEICAKECNRTYFIQTLDDLNLELPKSVELVGITAGASTPNNIIEEVQNYVRINF